MCIDGEVNILVHCRTVHNAAWSIRRRTRPTCPQTSLNLLGESIPTTPAVAWAFTQHATRWDYVLTFRQQVVRLSGWRFQPPNDTADEQ